MSEIYRCEGCAAGVYHDCKMPMQGNGNTWCGDHREWSPCWRCEELAEVVKLRARIATLEAALRALSAVVKSDWCMSYFTYAHVHGITMSAEQVAQTEAAWKLVDAALNTDGKDGG